MVRNITYWRTETIGFKEYQVTSIEYAPFGWEKTNRYVITREKKADRQGDLFTGDDFTYRAIMTNNREMTDLEVVEFYNDILTDFISKKLDFIKPNFRLKKFIFRFMVVPSKWITQGRQQILKLFSSKKYHLLLG